MARIPRRAIALDVQTTDSRFGTRRTREVLVVGELALGLRTELARRGAELTLTDDASKAFELLAERSFAVVVVNRFAAGNGIDFINAIKEGDGEHQRTIATVYGPRGGARFLSGISPPTIETFEEARRRHRLTPFILLPVDEKGDYAVIVAPPNATFVEDGKSLPLVTAIMSVDAGALLASLQPLA